ncbi:sigma-70 family RNA polymerase sigma factor [Ruania alba]|uniref:RNA polymerase sigma factor, sigma-70 family n=1 Tax=Ruania alba TaxID=648782 RepID=A0A1H5MF88_9MICO|nr:sigma-70 family RNA polymerase sigma factor [Ruania alba]SEE87986.1 RNA polymerase sigma factor, sigma-70 family [Ruania alba]
MSLAHDLEAPDSDEAIVAAVRRGRVGEFAVLYERYKDEALRIARRDAGPDDGPDLVQEAFARVLRAIRNGGGPTEDVAGYLFRTLRNLRIDRGTRREVPSDDIEALSPPGLWVVEDDADGALDRGLVSDAFKELPPRWREVLWLTEVEGAGPGELSDRMGMRPTAVSTLSARARHGFRSAWLQAHVRSGDVPAECRPVVARLGDYQTGRLSPRRRAEVERHLDGCAACPALIAELTAVSERLGVLLLPIVILAPKAIWWVFGSGLAKAGVLLVGGIGQARHAIHDPKVALSAGGGTVAAGVIVAAAFMWLSPGGESPADATPSEPSTSAPAATAPSSPAVPPSSTAPDDQPTPTPEPTPDPDPTPTPEPTPDPDPAPAPDQRRAPAPGPAPDPTRDPTPQPSPEPTPTPEPSLPTPDPPTIATPPGLCWLPRP